VSLVALRQIRSLGWWHNALASGHLDVREPAAGSASCRERERSTVFYVETPVGTYAGALQSVVPHQSIDSGAIDF
jgi:hypothetical protein